MAIGSLMVVSAEEDQGVTGGDRSGATLRRDGRGASSGKGAFKGDLNEARQGAARTRGEAFWAAGAAGAEALRRGALTRSKGPGREEASGGQAGVVGGEGRGPRGLVWTWDPILS